MRLTLNWLKDYVEIEIPAKELADKLTMVGLEITSLEKRDGDYLFDIEVTTNRPDCLSVMGIAREVAAITNKKLKVSRKSGIPLSYIRCSAGKSLKFKEKYIKHKTLNIKQPSIKVGDKKGCRFYSARVIADVKVKPSPEWLKERLELVRIRPVNNIVDITNYVLIETGQPLHAFDYDKLTDSPIIVRRAKENEKIVTIDGIERTLDSNILIIADVDRPIAIAGIMGGRDTQVTNQTKNILLESAYFDAATIRRVAKLLGITTESSYRFERGVDPRGVLLASDRAVSLILKLAAGKLVASKEKRQRVKCRHREIILRVSRVNQILGINLSSQEIKRILKSLQLKVTKHQTPNTKHLKVTIPSFRQDLIREIDLIEELIRIYGYDKIPTSFPYIKPTAQSPQPKNRIVESLIREVLVSQGLNEVINYSLLGREILSKTLFGNEKSLISIRNPLSAEQELIRPSLIPGLLNCICYNLNRQLKDIKIFELGHIYSDTSPKERLHLAIAITGKRYNDWLRKSIEVNLFDLKGIIEILFERLGISISDLEFSRGGNYPFLSDDKAAVLKLKGRRVGYIGQVSRKILEQFDLTEDIYLTEVSLDIILPYLNLEKRFKPLPKYPSISRDMAIVVKEEIPSSQVTSIITEVGSSILNELRLFDQYYGEQIPQGYKSLAYCLRYYLKDRTLTDNEVTQLHNKICQKLMEKLGAKIR